MSNQKQESIKLIYDNIDYMKRMLNAAKDMLENGYSESKVCMQNDIDKSTFRRFMLKNHKKYTNDNDDRLDAIKTNIAPDDIDALRHFMPWQEQFAMQIVACKEKYPYPKELENINSESWLTRIESLPPDIVETMDYLISTLTEREEKVIKMYWKNNYSFSKIADVLHVTCERIRQIYAKAIRKLRHKSRLPLIIYGLECHNQFKDNIALKRAQYDRQKKERLGHIKQEEPTKNLNTHAEYLIDEYNKKGDLELETLNLSARTYNALKKAGYYTLNQLRSVDIDDLSHIRGLGKKSQNEIIKHLRTILGSKIEYVI